MVSETKPYSLHDTIKLNIFSTISELTELKTLNMTGTKSIGHIYSVGSDMPLSLCYIHCAETNILIFSY